MIVQLNLSFLTCIYIELTVRRNIYEYNLIPVLILTRYVLLSRFVGVVLTFFRLGMRRYWNKVCVVFART